MVQVGVVYLYNAILNSVALWGTSIPHQGLLLMGYVCMPVEYSKASSLFFWLVFTPLLIGIPMLYLQYVCFDVWWNKMLPPRGKRRELGEWIECETIKDIPEIEIEDSQPVPRAILFKNRNDISRHVGTGICLYVWDMLS